MTVALTVTVSFKLMFLTLIFAVLLQYHFRHAPSFDRSQILARGPSLSHHHHHHIRFWYLRCGCPGLRGRQHLATPHTRSP